MTAKVARRALVQCYRYFVALRAEVQTLESGFEQKTGVEHMQKNERKKDSEWNDICYNVVTICMKLNRFQEKVRDKHYSSTANLVGRNFYLSLCLSLRLHSLMF